MPTLNPSTVQDAVSSAVLHAQQAAGRHPIPLVTCGYDIAIAGGLADVAVKRTYRNEEVGSIEATLTLPLPVDAVMHHLEARIDGRLVTATAQAREEARASYETAIDRGKTAVLHEELLKGIHMLSVGQIRPGAEIVVTARFALPLAFIGGRAQLRIPTTVGDVYGNSGLIDSDDLASGGVVLAASTRVTSDSGRPQIAGATLKDGATRVPLDRPILVTLEGWMPRTLHGRSADGRALTLAISQAPAGDRPIAAAILVDRSGSMSEHAAGGSGLSKHAAVVVALSAAAALLHDRDTIDLWQFDDAAEHIGTAGAGTWRETVHRLNGPRGGTEIGGAIEKVLAAGNRDLMIVTDGKSHALNVQKLLASGARFTVVLIGEDSLEANVGHLAIGSGGQVLAGDGVRVGDAVTAALNALRSPLSQPASDEAREIVAARGGMIVTATWGEDVQRGGEVQAHGRAAAAYAASLRLPALGERKATALAVAEGLVTHLTSLVLVDEAGTASETVPVARKVALPSPARSRMFMYVGVDMAFAACAAPSSRGIPDKVALARSRKVEVTSAKRSVAARSAKRPAGSADIDAARVRSAWDEALAGIDWMQLGPDLVCGETTGLPVDIDSAIDLLARQPTVGYFATGLPIGPRLLVIALMAHVAGSRDRHAARVARALLAGVPPDIVTTLVPLLSGAASTHGASRGAAS